MSVIDFESSDPIWLKIRIRGMEITQCVRPEFGGIRVEQDTTYATDYLGNHIAAFHNKAEVKTDISFHAIPTGGKDEVLMTAAIIPKEE